MWGFQLLPNPRDARQAYGPGEQLSELERTVTAQEVPSGWSIGELEVLQDPTVRVRMTGLVGSDAELNGSKQRCIASGLGST